MRGLISAIVPTYNRSNFLSEAIAALTTQTRPLHEIIIWDDGSTDDTQAIARTLAATNLRSLIKYYKTENRGKSAALNGAIAEASGDYIWICDDDDIARPDAAEKMGVVLDNGTAGLVGGRHVRFSRSERSGEKEFTGTGYWPDFSSGSVIRHILEDIFFFQNASLVRQTSLATVGPFNTDLKRSIDYEMFVRLGTRFPIDMVDDVLFEQRKHDGIRGSASHSHAADKSDSVWKKADSAIFSGLRDTIPIEFYAAFFEAALPEQAMRAALLQRGCVFARRGDWEIALDDFNAAAQILPTHPLTQVEKSISARAMAAKHPSPEVFKDPIRNKLLALKRTNFVGLGIVSALGRGSVWRARVALQDRDPGQFLRIAAFCAQSGVNPKPRKAPHYLAERKFLQPEAYTW
jgi:glycosyltransferase involved in cell wall biosynthesis